MKARVKIFNMYTTPIYAKLMTKIITFITITNTIVVTITKGELMADVGLIAHMVANDIVERQDDWQDCLEGLPSVALRSAILVFG